MIKAVLFDLDGTLIDDESFTLSSKTIEGKKIGYDIDEATAKKSLGMSYENSKNYFRALYGADFPFDFFRQKRFEYIVEDMRKNGIRWKDGAEAIVGFCRENGIRTAICTSSSRKYLDAYASFTDLFSKIDRIVSGEDVKKGKPDPEIFLRAIEGFGIRSDEALVIEDSHNGVEAGLRSGADVIMVPDLLEPDPEFVSNGGKVYKSLRDVIKYIEKKNGVIGND